MTLNLLSEPYMLFIYSLIVLWTIFSAFYIWKVSSSNNTASVNEYIYDSIPGVFTTLGVLGTFLGIFFGLLDFDVKEITGSIPKLLEGMKTAFLSSIIGIALSLIVGKLSQIVWGKAEESSPPKVNSEIAVLNNIANTLNEIRSITINNHSRLTTNLWENENSIGAQVKALALQFTDLSNSSNNQLDMIKGLDKSIIKTEKSMVKHLSMLNEGQDVARKEAKKGREDLTVTLEENKSFLSEKFDDFSVLLAKNNTEALVEVMKTATTQFNDQMSALIEKLVQENFAELNNSVQSLNTWQTENKEMIISLTGQFKQVSEDFGVTSKTLQIITENTSTLTDKNSNLVSLITELQKVMIDDTKFTEITDKIIGAVDTLKANTEAFDATTNRLNTWVRNQMNFTDSVDALLIRLREIDEIKDINDVFWKNTEKQLNEGVTIIKNASSTLANDLEEINGQFYDRLNDTLQNLDNLIVSIIRRNDN
jgi:hypothetical protein